ncbi:MAG: hypothetical protein HN509_00445 [Halobacteriovoraceae bacterium]|jgi:hypothetical protein|nr:hypothetical protein [Halobacteriovoraceae bacterium]
MNFKYYLLMLVSISLMAELAHADNDHKRQQNRDQRNLLTKMVDTITGRSVLTYAQSHAHKIKVDKKIAVQHALFDAPSEILKEVGESGYPLLVAKYYVRNGRIHHKERANWSEATNAEYMSNYRIYPQSIEPSQAITTREGRIEAEKVRQEELQNYLKFARSIEERLIIVKLLGKTRYVTEADRFPAAFTEKGLTITQDRKGKAILIDRGDTINLKRIPTVKTK